MEISSTDGKGSLWLFNSFFQLAWDFEGRSDGSKLSWLSMVCIHEGVGKNGFLPSLH